MLRVRPFLFSGSMSACHGTFSRDNSSHLRNNAYICGVQLKPFHDIDMLELSKEKSTIIKGIAISLMLFLHLFDYHNADGCINFFHIGGMPLASWLARACNPVAIFLLLSGYGLACKHEKKALSPLHQAERSLFLYLHYWIILAVMLAIGHVMLPSLYPGSWGTVIENLTGWHTTYNKEMWFLFPYVLVSIVSLYTFRAVDKVGLAWAVGITAVLYIAISVFINRNSTMLYDNLPLFHLLLFVQFLYPFTMGATLRRTSINLNRALPQWAVMAGIIVLVLILCVSNIHLCYMFCAPLMVILFCHLHYPQWLQKILTELGRKSMPMWMIHTWLAYYLFHDQVYALRYPVLIFLGLLLASYLLSIPVMWAAKRIHQLATSLRN